MMLIIRQLCFIGRLGNNKNNNYSIFVHGLPGKFVGAFATADEGAGIIALDRCGSKLWAATVQNFRPRIELAGRAKEFGFYTSTTLIT